VEFIDHGAEAAEAGHVVAALGGILSELEYLHRPRLDAGNQVIALLRMLIDHHPE